jgi:hypothetical protein
MTVNDVNPFAQRLELVVEPRITGKKWYLFADPEIMPVLQYSFLEGYEGPQIETEQGFDIEGTKFKVRMDLATAAVDWRGAYYNSGLVG